MNERSEVTDQEYDFSWSEWSARFPYLANVFSPKTIEMIAEEAALIFNPTKTCIVCDHKTRKVIFYTLVAHCVELEKRSASGNPLTGVITSVSEGSISVGATSGDSKTPDFLNSTLYGKKYWQMILKYRTFKFRKPIPDRRNRIFP